MRLLISILFLAAAATAGPGCVGNVGDENTDDGGDATDGDPLPTGKQGRAIFKRDVFPAVLKCSGGACHDTTGTSGAISKFYNADADISYDASIAAVSLVGNPISTIAPLLTHIAASHKGMVYSDDEKSKITNWLSVEVDERKNDTPTMPPFDPKVVLREWSGCLSLANFTTANMTQAWSTLASSDRKSCLTCHNGGIDGFYISNNAQNFFTAISTQSAYMLKYFGVNSAERKIVVNRGSFESANLIPNHPLFPIDNAGMVALVKLYDLTMARKAANQCDPSRLIEP